MLTRDRCERVTCSFEGTGRMTRPATPVEVPSVMDKSAARRPIRPVDPLPPKKGALTAIAGARRGPDREVPDDPTRDVELSPFAAWLRRELHATRMSQRQLALRSGVNHSTISRLLRDAREPSYRTAFRLARTFGSLPGSPLVDDDDSAARSAPSSTARVERALRSDRALREADVRSLMEAYVRLRAHRLMGSGGPPFRLRSVGPGAG
jgi:transcriptional regulator with XRE-family HTH domain